MKKNKKAYTPRFNKPFNNKASRELLKYITEELGHKPDDKLNKLIFDLAQKGANVITICRALVLPGTKWHEKTKSFDLTRDYRSKKYFTKKSVIKSALRTLLELNPVFPEYSIGQKINREITNMKAELKKYEPWIERYINLLLYEGNFDKLKEDLSKRVGLDESSKDSLLKVIRSIYPYETLRMWTLKASKPAMQSTHNLWDESLVLLVKELGRIGYSMNNAYKTTAELLALACPDVYKDKDPNLIRQRYTYHTKK